MDRTLRALAKFESSRPGLILGTQITPQGWIFWIIIFYHQKIQVKSYLMRGQTLFWVHYKLVIEMLKHTHFLTNYLKLQILASCNNLRIEQDSEFVQFSPRALQMSKFAKLLPLSCLKRYFLKVLQWLSEFLYHY